MIARLIVTVSLLVLCGCSATNRLPLMAADSVDLIRYQGLWYEIGSLPGPFQEGCYATTAQYQILSPGRVSVRNCCRSGSPTGATRCAEGIAWPIDESGAKLKVRFFWPFVGDYWILKRDDNYQYALVGHPERKYLWILSRSPELDRETVQQLLTFAEGQGYELKEFRLMQQPVQTK